MSLPEVVRSLTDDDRCITDQDVLNILDSAISDVVHILHECSGRLTLSDFLTPSHLMTLFSFVYALSTHRSDYRELCNIAYERAVSTASAMDPPGSASRAACDRLVSFVFRYPTNRGQIHPPIENG